MWDILKISRISEKRKRVRQSSSTCAVLQLFNFSVTSLSFKCHTETAWKLIIYQADRARTLISSIYACLPFLLHVHPHWLIDTLFWHLTHHDLLNKFSADWFVQIKSLCYASCNASAYIITNMFGTLVYLYKNIYSLNPELIFISIPWIN